MHAAHRKNIEVTLKHSPEYLALTKDLLKGYLLKTFDKLARGWTVERFTAKKLGSVVSLGVVHLV